MFDSRIRRLGEEGVAPLPTGKRPVATARRLVARPALVARLDAHPGSVLIQAPAGYGKSTLVAQWLADRQRVAWVTLRGEHNDVATLWDAIIGTAVGQGLGEPMLSSLRRRSVSGHAAAREATGNGQAMPAPLTLVLDDYHAITDVACRRLLDHLLIDTPASLQVVAISREAPTTDLSRLLVGGELLQVSARELAFTREEIEELGLARGFSLSATATDHLHQVTEGWPAGLLMAFISIEGAGGSDVSATLFNGANRLIADYFNEEVMARLDADLADFVLTTSPLQIMSGPLCDMVTGRAGSREMLVEIERRGVFVDDVDDRRESYRYHRLFSEFLEQAAALSGVAVPDVHRRAGAWFAAERRTGEAVGHLLAAGEIEQAIEVVASAYRPAVESARVLDVEGWLRLFPRRTVTGDARLSVIEAWVMSILQRPAEAAVALDNAARAPHRAPLPDGAGSVEASGALIAASFPDRDVGRMVEAARRVFELEGGKDRELAYLAHVLYGVDLYFAGATATAVPILERAAALSRASERWMDESGASCVRAWAALDQGEPDVAMEWATRAVAVAEAAECTATPYGGYAAATLATVSLRHNGTRGTVAALRDALEIMRMGVEPLILAQCLLALAGARSEMGAKEDALAALADAREILAGFVDPGMLGTRLAMLSEAFESATPAGGEELSRRELEVLRHIEKGLTNREIAAALYVSYNTIHTHVRAIYRKLDVSNRDDAVAAARARGHLTDT